MAKKNSMPDFTFALGADLREAAAKMREMSRPPKHDASEPVADAVPHTPEDAIPNPPSPDPMPKDVSEPSVTAEDFSKPAAPEPSGELQSETAEPRPAEPADPETLPEPTGEAPVFAPESPAPAPEAEETASALPGRENTPETSPRAETIPAAAAAAAGDSAPAATVSPAAPETPAASTGAQPADGAAALDPVRDDGPLAFEPERTAEQSAASEETAQQVPSSTVIDGHGQFNAVNDRHTQLITPHVVDGPETVNSSHQQSQTVVPQSLKEDQPSMTVHDNHGPSVPVFPEPERLTAVSTSPVSEQPHDDCAPTVTDSHIAVPKKEQDPVRAIPGKPADTPGMGYFSETAEASLGMPNAVHQQSSTVTMTVTDNRQQPVIAHDFPKRTSPATPPAASVPPSIASATLQEAHLGGARQVLLDALTELRQQSPQVVVNLKRLAPAIGLSYGTVRNTISRLVREGVICTTQVRTGDAHGVCIEFLDDSPLPSLTAIAQPVRQAMTRQQPSLTVTTQSSHQQTMTTDDTCIWNTDADLISILWPNAASAGFGPAHLAQLRRAYQLQGWEPENVPRCLRYLDWELANGIAAGPEHVTAWLRVMQRQGHYPRPEGYVDPEVLRLRQQAEEERELAEARARFK